jgi:hypothetical protein
MTTRATLASLTLIACTLLPIAVQAQNSVADLDKSIDLQLGDHVRVHQLLTDLQQSVVQHNAAEVAALVRYPIKVNPGRHPIMIRSPKAFIKDYDKIITPDIATVIEKQKYESLFINSQGAMLGDGEVWIASFCLDKGCKKTDIKIGTIQDTTNLKP